MGPQAHAGSNPVSAASKQAMLRIAARIDASDLQQQLQQLPQEINQALSRALDQAAALLVQSIQRHTPVGTGVLQRAIYWHAPAELHRLVQVSPPADAYAAPVEYGSSPHLPPIAALHSWVQVKLGVTDQAQARSIAFAVARTIARRGTRQHAMFQRGLQQAEQAVLELVQRALDQALGE